MTAPITGSSEPNSERGESVKSCFD
uniref:Protein F09G8.5 n=1 Tax=Haemonchus contortus TaxID=6289 RepID=A0A7I4YMA6_HAECO